MFSQQAAASSREPIRIRMPIHARAVHSRNPGISAKSPGLSVHSSASCRMAQAAMAISISRDRARRSERYKGRAERGVLGPERQCCAGWQQLLLIRDPLCGTGAAQPLVKHRAWQSHAFSAFHNAPERRKGASWRGKSVNQNRRVEENHADFIPLGGAALPTAGPGEWRRFPDPLHAGSAWQVLPRSV